MTLFPILLFVFALFGEWMITGNGSLYPSALQVKLDLGVTWDILNRQLYLPWFIIIAVVIAAYFLFYNTIVRFCSWLASLCYNRKTTVHPYHTRPFSEYVKTMNVQYSYNIRNNDNTGRFQSFALSVVPEPSSALLGGLGMLCLLRRRRA